MVSGIKGSKYEPPERISVENSNYNSEKARKLLGGTLEQRIIQYAEINYSKGKEVAAELSKGNYREQGKDPFEVLDRICGYDEGEYWGEETPKSIDDTVKPSLLKVAVKGTINLLNKTRWYYPLVGALPGKYQKKIAEKLGDNPSYYTVSNMGAELVGATTLAYLATGQSAAGAAFFVVSLLTYSFIRSAVMFSGYKSSGSVIATLPYYVTLYSILAVKAAPQAIASAGKAVKNAVIDSYSSVGKEQQKLLAAPKKRRHKKKKRIEEQKQPEIVMTIDGERFVYPEAEPAEDIRKKVLEKYGQRD